jgi:hypothetical protein
LRKAGFELVDFINCKPTPGFKKCNPQKYKWCCRIPAFSIYVAQKKDGIHRGRILTPAGQALLTKSAAKIKIGK